jgi:hypothetical protein
MPAFVPAPKSLVSSTAASQVAAVNSNISSDAGATLTSLSARPIESAIGPIVANRKVAQLSLGPNDQAMKVGETRRLVLDLKSDAPLALAILALRFDPKIVKLKAFTESGSSVGLSQSTDAAGVCLISVSNLSGMTGPGTLLYIDVEGIAPGEAGLMFEKGSTHLVAADASELGVEFTPVRATVK